jgi:cell division septum initiation protein DivIVA
VPAAAAATLRSRLDEEQREREELSAAYSDLKVQLKGKTKEVDDMHRALAKARAAGEAERIRAAAAAKHALDAAQERCSAAEAEAAGLREALREARLAAAASPAAHVALEARRLGEENEALGERVASMQAELLATAQLLGHGNQAQRLQYHQRLKAQAEEMRGEATAALREKFALEQCVRFLAVKAQLPEAVDEHRGAAGMAPRAAVDTLQPESLARQAGGAGARGGGGGGAQSRAGAAEGEDIEARMRRLIAEVCAVKRPRQGGA